jgi:hypothetical protein
MCRHVEARPGRAGWHPSHETKREVLDSLSDIEESLDLTKRLLLLADGHWKACEHSGSLPLEGILRDCAHRILAETRRCRMELEAKGKVHFGLVMLEESADRDEPNPVSDFQWGDPMILPGPKQEGAAACSSDVSPAVRAKKFEPSPLGALRRLCTAILVRPPPQEPRESAREPRQGGT